MDAHAPCQHSPCLPLNMTAPTLGRIISQPLQSRSRLRIYNTKLQTPRLVVEVALLRFPHLQVKCRENHGLCKISKPTTKAQLTPTANETSCRPDNKHRYILPYQTCPPQEEPTQTYKWHESRDSDLCTMLRHNKK
jgi:hypothetical protein